MNFFARNASALLVAVLLLGSSLVLAQKNKHNEGYRITVRLDNYQNDTVILGYFIGKQSYVSDTAIGKNSKNEFVFEGKKSLALGTYMVLLKPENTYFEILIANEEEQKNIYFRTDASVKNLSQKLVVKGSKENEAFIQYIQFLGRVNERGNALQEDLEEAKETKDKAKENELIQKLDNLGEEVKAYQNQLIEEQPDYLIAKLILASRLPEVPTEIRSKQPEAYLYYRRHYFDGFDWTDGRLARSKILREKMDFYIDKLTVQHPDSISSGVNYLLDKAYEGDTLIYKYMVTTLLNRYAKTEVICMDAVYVNIALRYYCSGKTPWVGEEQLEKICQDANDLKGSLCNRPAPDFQLSTVDDKQFRLYATKSKFTVLYFWDPTCSNCTKNSKKLVPIAEKWIPKGVYFVGICSKSQKEVDQCKDKIKEVKMPWVNLSDQAQYLGWVKKIYNIKMNPYMLLLDEDKKILYKRIVPDQLDEILTRLIEEKEKEVESRPDEESTN